MTGPNGRAQQESTSPSVVPLVPSAMTAVSQFGAEKVKELVAELQVPFDPLQIEWRVMNTVGVGSLVGIGNHLPPHRLPVLRPVPKLAGWATPDGWLQGLRPRCACEQKPIETRDTGSLGNGQQNGNGTSTNGDVVREIERMQSVVGKRMYRGLLKVVARVWNPRDIQDPAVQQKVLAHMQSAERGLRRAEAARDKAGLAAFAAVLQRSKLRSLDQVDNLKTLQEIVVALETAASRAK